MATRGAFGLTHKGQTKMIYNHWDSYPEGYDSDRIWIVKWLDGEPTDDRDEDADIDIVAVNEYKDHSIDTYLTALEDAFS